MNILKIVLYNTKVESVQGSLWDERLYVQCRWLQLVTINIAKGVRLLGLKAHW